MMNSNIYRKYDIIRIGGEDFLLKNGYVSTFSYPHIEEKIGGYYKVRRRDGKYNLIDENNNTILKEWCDHCTNIINERTIVWYDKLSHLVDINGDFITKEYSHIDTCRHDDYYVVKHNDTKLWNVIDKNGNLQLKKWYSEIIIPFKMKLYFIVKENNIYYILDRNNKIICNGEISEDNFYFMRLYKIVYVLNDNNKYYAISKIVKIKLINE